MALAKNKWNLGEKKKLQEGPHKERAVLIGVVQPPHTEEKVLEYLDELEFLAQTAGADTAKRFIQKMAKPDSKTFIGRTSRCWAWRSSGEPRRPKARMCGRTEKFSTPRTAATTRCA